MEESMATEYEYKIVKAASHDKLAIAINVEAADGWEPMNAYAWGYSSNAPAMPRCCAVRREPRSAPTSPQ